MVDTIGSLAGIIFKNGRFYKGDEVLQTGEIINKIVETYHQESSPEQTILQKLAETQIKDFLHLVSTQANGANKAYCENILNKLLKDTESIKDITEIQNVIREVEIFRTTMDMLTDNNKPVDPNENNQGSEATTQETQNQNLSNQIITILSILTDEQKQILYQGGKITDEGQNILKTITDFVKNEIDQNILNNPKQLQSEIQSQINKIFDQPSPSPSNQEARQLIPSPSQTLPH